MALESVYSFCLSEERIKLYFKAFYLTIVMAGSNFSATWKLSPLGREKGEEEM